MLPVLNARQIRDADAYTISHEPVNSIDLMERACHAFVEWFVKRFSQSKKVNIFCGHGNNGGDGLASARMLIALGYPVSVSVVGEGSGSPDFSTNLRRLEMITPVERISNVSQLKPLSNEIVVDALFGSGLSRPIEGIFATVVDWINRQPVVRVAIDIPSGLLADQPSSGAVVQANYTVTFQVPRLSFFLPGSFRFVGEWTVLDIGLDQTFIQKQETPHYLVEERDVASMIHPRSRFDHKGTYGKALLVCGGYGKMGAAILAARAAIHSGLGLLVTHVPESGYPIIQTAVPEAMASVDRDTRQFSEVPPLDGYDAVGVGPGIGTGDRTAKALGALLQEFGKPMVLDADALNILAEQREMLHLVPSQSILTPHPGEFQRLVGAWSDDFQRLNFQSELAKRLNSVILVKGAFTTIAFPDGRFFFNPTGNPGMATGGMGDVLTGLVTGLLAQGYSAQEASLLAAFLHGRAGDLAAKRMGYEALTASDLLSSLSAAFLSIQPKEDSL